MATGKDIEGLRKALRAKLRDGAQIAVDSGDLRQVLDELGRLQQSNDRLRRQNRRVRLKLQRAGLVEDADEATDDGSEPQV